MEKEEQIKEAFQKVKQDIDSIKYENNLFKEALIKTHQKLSDIVDILKKITDINLSLSNLLEKFKKNKGTIQPINTLLSNETPIITTPTLQHINPTLQHINPTHPTNIKPLNSQILTISIGNEGVPTDRQTDRQTDKPTEIISNNIQNMPKNTILQENRSPIQDASEILDSLDSLKKEIRLKFKRLTNQEILVFSTLYQLEEEQGYTDYKSISSKLNLTESSIRDYVGKLINKGIPINKTKINNKNIQISISNSLKKIASLQTILQLRDL